MKWEYELMREMLQRATLHLDTPTPECHKTGAMLRQAATVMTQWDRKIFKLEKALRLIIETGERPSVEIAREALE